MYNWISVAKKIIEEAQKDGIELRSFGRIGVAIHCQLKEIETKDIDLVGNIFQVHLVDDFFKKIGFLSNSFEHTPTHKGEHISYKLDKNRELKVDLYLGDLFFNHRIPKPYITKEDEWTIPVTQLFLSKLAIFQISDKDLNDAAFILKTHKVGNSTDNKEEIKKNILRQVWCFECNGWNYSNTCNTNLEKMKKISTLDNEIITKINVLQNIIYKSKKSCCWNTGKILETGKPKPVEAFYDIDEKM